MPFTWQSAIAYAQLVNIAYSVDPANQYSQTAISSIQQAGYTFVGSINGNDLATNAHRAFALPVTYGFVATSNAGELVAVIRGTATQGAAGILEWAHDFAFGTVPSPIRGGQGETEDGFSDVYDSLTLGTGAASPKVAAAMAGLFAAGGINSISITGHSLGGALSSLLALDLALNGGIPRAPVVYTFASPNVGLQANFVPQYNRWVPESYRVFNRFDLVPKLPPPPYGSVGSDQELVPPLSAIDANLAWHHFLDTYILLMEQKAAGSA